MIENLPDELINIIATHISITCHICNSKTPSYPPYKFYKKVSNFYFCSQLCYEFI